MTAYLSSIRYLHGDLRPIDEIPELARDASALRYLRNLGLERYSHQTRGTLDVLDEVIRGTLTEAGLKSADVDATIFFSTMFDLESEQSDLASISHKLGLTKAVSFGMFLNQCSNHSQCLLFARSLLKSEGYRNILLIGSDRIHGAFPRTMPNNTSVYSDVATCCLVSSEDLGQFRLHGIKHKYLPDMAELSAGGKVVEFIERYSHGFKSVCEDLYSSMGNGPDAFRHLITANYNQSVLKNLCRLAGIAADRLYQRNLPRFGHCFSSDQLISLETLIVEGNLRKGDLLNLVAVGGFWTYSAVCVEKT
jgi:3-oxoacyl-[acyl-carrier-protein] synthase-3